VYFNFYVLDRRREYKRLYTEWCKEVPEFNLLLIFSLFLIWARNFGSHQHFCFHMASVKNIFTWLNFVFILILWQVTAFKVETSQI